MIRITLIFFVVLAFGSCKTTQLTVVEEVMLDTSPKILFVMYKFQKGQLVLDDKVITEGTLKDDGLSSTAPKVGDFIFSQVDNENNVLAQEVVKDPRTRTVEYADDSGLMQKKEVKVENAEFMIRVMLQPQAAFLTIEEFNEDKNKIKLLSSKEIR